MMDLNQLPSDFIDFEKKIMHRNLPKFVQEDIKLLPQARLLEFELPRGHIKTTTYSHDYAVYNLWRQEDFKIGLSCSAREQSWGILSMVQNTIESNPDLKWLKPESKFDSKWNSTRLVTSNGNSMQAFPLNDSIRSFHGDLFLCDDIQRAEDVTQDDVKKVFWGCLFPTMQTRKGKTIVVGTPMTTDDLLSDLLRLSTATKDDPELFAKKQICMKANMLPVCVRRQAVITNPAGQWLAPLWGENFTLDELEAMKVLQGSLIFDREYMCNPRAGGSSIFTEALLARRHSLVLNIGREGHEYYLGIDVAISKDSAADFSAFIIIEMDPYRNLMEVKIERYKGKDTSWQIERIRELHNIFYFRKIVVEDKGLSQGMARDMSNDAVLRSVIELFKTERKNKELMISRIESALSTGQLTLLDDSIHINELRSFGIKKDKYGKETYEALGGHDDTVMALGMALEAALQKPIGTASFDVIGAAVKDVLDEEETKNPDDCPKCDERMKRVKNREFYCDSCKTTWVL